jgi:hypothetical protein
MLPSENGWVPDERQEAMHDLSRARRARLPLRPKVPTLRYVLLPMCPGRSDMVPGGGNVRDEVAEMEVIKPTMQLSSPTSVPGRCGEAEAIGLSRRSVGVGGAFPIEGRLRPLCVEPRDQSSQRTRRSRHGGGGTASMLFLSRGAQRQQSAINRGASQLLKDPGDGAHVLRFRSCSCSETCCSCCC